MNKKNLSKNNNFKILSNNNQYSFNVMKLKKYKNLTKSEKIIKIIKEKEIRYLIMIWKIYIKNGLKEKKTIKI